MVCFLTVRGPPAAMSMEQSVGEPRLAARWRGVFPQNVLAFTSAFSCRWRRTATVNFKVYF